MRFAGGRVEIQNLEAFLHVARERSFTRAAAALFLTQPSVTARIQALEQELGRPLFERRGRTVRLTDVGEALLPYATRALELLQEGAEAARESEGQGTISIGATVSAATSILPDLIVDFRRLHPEVRITIRYGHSNEVLEALRDGLVDAAFVVRSLHEPLVSLEPVIADPIVLVVPPGHPLAARASVPIADVVTERLISMQWGEGFEEFERWMADEMRARATIYADGIPLGMMLIARGAGVGFAPSRTVEAYEQAGLVRAKSVRGIPPAHHQIFLALRTPRRLSASTQAFVDMTRSRFPRPALPARASRRRPRA
jgi:DNA-binding transcriptional LysR family regulator